MCPQAKRQEAMQLIITASQNEKKRVQLLQNWQQELKVEATQNAQLLSELRNLTILKEVLGERLARRRDMFDYLIDNIDIW